VPSSSGVSGTFAGKIRSSATPSRTEHIGNDLMRGDLH
jgi:hypothetical protein